jgi:hypothetical protein
LKDKKMEKAIRGSVRQVIDYQTFLESWKRHGFPKNFSCDKNGKRILDAPAMREMLEYREHPERRRDRILRGELEFRAKTRRLYR